MQVSHVQPWMLSCIQGTFSFQKYKTYMKNNFAAIVFVIVCCIASDAYAWRWIHTGSTRSHKRFSSYERSCRGLAATCECSWHRYLRHRMTPMTAEAEKLYRNTDKLGKKVEEKDIGNGKVEVTTTSLCRICNGTGESMQKMCTKCNGRGIQINVRVKPKRR